MKIYLIHEEPKRWVQLTLKVPITTITDDKFCDIFPNFRKKIRYVCLFRCFTSQVSSYGHGGMVSSHNHTFFLGKLEQTVNQFFVHILSLVTDKNPAEGRRMTVEIIS